MCVLKGLYTPRKEPESKTPGGLVKNSGQEKEAGLLQADKHPNSTINIQETQTSSQHCKGSYISLRLDPYV